MVKKRLSQLKLLFFTLLCWGCTTGVPLETYTPLERHYPTLFGKKALPKKELTLKECLHLARDRNRTLAQAKLAARNIYAKSTEYLQGVILPRLKANATYTARDRDPLIQAGGFRIALSNRQVFQSGLFLEAPLFSFGKFWQEYRALQAFGKAASENQKEQWQSLARQIVQLYFELLALESQIQRLKFSIRLLESERKRTKALFQQGLAIDTDVSRIDLALRERKLTQTHLQLQHKLGLQQLKLLLDIPLSQPLSLAKSRQVPSFSLTKETCYRRVLNRPALQEVRYRLQGLQYQYASLTGRFLPTLALQGAALYSDDKSLVHKNWLQVTLGLEWSLFEGGRRLTLLQEKRREIQQLQLAYRELCDTLLGEVDTLFLRLQEARERLSLAKQALDLAKKTFRQTQLKYRQGLVTAVDLLQEETQWLQNQLAYEKSLYELQRWFWELRVVIGEFS